MLKTIAKNSARSMNILYGCSNPTTSSMSNLPGCVSTRADYTAHEGRWETTNQHFFVDLPAGKRLAQPALYNAPLDKSNFIRAGLTKECFDGSMADETPGGRAGARGKCCLFSHTHQYTIAILRITFPLHWCSCAQTCDIHRSLLVVVACL